MGRHGWTAPRFVEAKEQLEKLNGPGVPSLGPLSIAYCMLSPSERVKVDRRFDGLWWQMATAGLIEWKEKR